MGKCFGKRLARRAVVLKAGSCRLPVYYFSNRIAKFPIAARFHGSNLNENDGFAL